MKGLKKYKFQLLGIAIVLVIMILNRYLFSKTYDLYVLTNDNEKLISQNNLLIINESNDEYNVQNAQERFIIKQEDYNALVVDKLSKLCILNSCKLIEITDGKEYQDIDIRVRSVDFSMSGPFKQLLNILYEMEIGKINGNISSLRYSIKTDHLQKRKELIMKITLQYIIK